ncbi:hypothetical protein HK096_009633, partial [Nowakowskiella sp. JEL0078]
MTFTSANIPDLTGKVAIVTGGNSGIGLETVRELSRKNAKVYLATRSQERFDAVIGDLKKSVPHGNIHFLELDLGDLTQSKNAAEKDKKSEKKKKK